MKLKELIPLVKESDIEVTMIYSFSHNKQYCEKLNPRFSCLPFGECEVAGIESTATADKVLQVTVCTPVVDSECREELRKIASDLDINFNDFITLFYKYSDLDFIKGLVTVLSKEQLLNEIPDFFN